MKNNTVFADRIERLIVADKLNEASTLLLHFLNQYSTKKPSAVAEDLYQQVVMHTHNLTDLNNRLLQNSIAESEAAAIEKNIWVAFHHINNQVRDLEEFETLATDTTDDSPFTYTPKKQTWRDAGWLPLLVAGLVVAVAFPIGIHYNNNRIKAEKAAKQTEIDAKNGISGRITEGVGALKLLEEKTITGMDSTIEMTIKKVVATDSSLDITVRSRNKSKLVLHDLDFTLINVEQNSNKIKMSDNSKILGDIAIETSGKTEIDKHIHFNIDLGENRIFLLYCAFKTADAPIEKSLGIPFTLR